MAYLWARRKFDPSFKAVAQAWWKKAPKAEKNSQLFASLDFSDGQAIFRKVTTTQYFADAHVEPLTLFSFLVSSCSSDLALRQSFSFTLLRRAH